MSHDPHRISGVIVRQINRDPDVQQNIQRQIDDAIAAAERAAYERGLYEGYDEGFAASAEGWNGEYPHRTPACATDEYKTDRAAAIRALIDKPKEPT